MIFDGSATDKTETFDETLKWAYATYFVFNRTYPEEQACTLEFLQRYSLNLNPESGSKSPNSGKVLAKVNTFCNKLNKYSDDFNLKNV